MSKPVLGYVRLGVIGVAMLFGTVCLGGGVLSGLTPLDAPFMSVFPGQAPAVSTIGVGSYVVGVWALIAGGEYRPRRR